MKWTKEEITVLNNNFFYNTYKELSVILNRTEGSIRGKAERMGLKKKENKVWSINEDNFLIKHYGIIPPIKIAIKLKRTIKSINLRAFGLKLTNKYTNKYFRPSYNEKFFNSWSYDLAWLVGIVLSDGHVSSSDAKTKYVSIKMCDKDVIYKIKNMLKFKNSIYQYVPTNHYKISYRITIYGDIIWNFFNDLGMDNNKSVTATFPNNIPDEFVSHVIRGLFDGDGSIIINKDKYLSYRICGTRNVIYSINDYVNLYSTIHFNKSKTNFIVQYTGERADKFFEYIYYNSNNKNRMDRKYNKYIKFITDRGNK